MGVDRQDTSEKTTIPTRFPRRPDPVSRVRSWEAVEPGRTDSPWRGRNAWNLSGLAFMLICSIRPHTFSTLFSERYGHFRILARCFPLDLHSVGSLNRLEHHRLLEIAEDPDVRHYTMAADHAREILHRRKELDFVVERDDFLVILLRIGRSTFPVPAPKRSSDRSKWSRSALPVPSLPVRTRSWSSDLQTRNAWRPVLRLRGRSPPQTWCRAEVPPACEHACRAPGCSPPLYRFARRLRASSRPTPCC